MSCNCTNGDTGVSESNATDCNQTECPTSTATCTNTCGCGCTPTSGATGAPYYNQAPGCQESHTSVCVQNQYVTGLTIANTFNMPGCNLTVSLLIPGLQSIVIGSYLWNPLYGYLKVISFDFATSTIVVENECQTGNAAVGTSIPRCTLFTVVDTPYGIENPCLETAVSEGSILVCNNQAIQPLASTANGQIPVVVDTANNIVEFTSVDLPISLCTTLTSDLVLLPANPGPYNMAVTDSTIFSIGNTFIVNGRPDRFTVTNLPDVTHIDATINPPTAGVEVIPAGSSVCHVPCCERIDNYLSYYTANPCTWDMTTRFGIVEADWGQTTVLPDGFLTPAPALILSNVKDHTIQNTKCKTGLVAVEMPFIVAFEPGAGANDWCWAGIDIMFATTTGALGAAPAPVPVTVEQLVYDIRPYSAAGVFTSYTYTHSVFYLIPANTERRFGAQMRVRFFIGLDGFTVLFYYDVKIGMKCSFVTF